MEVVKIVAMSEEHQQQRKTQERFQEFIVEQQLTRREKR